MKYDVAKLVECHRQIAPFIHATPVLTSNLVCEAIGCEVVLKCENFQKGGSYKIRGATFAMQSLTTEQRTKGVVTHSSGNFAQAVALASRQLGVKNYIVMPSSAPDVKVAAVKAYGGNLISCGPSLADREAAAEQIVRETGATLLHPSNDLNVIFGQGTTTLELLQDHPDLDACFLPVGGGGLISGACIAVNDRCPVIGGEPFAVDDAYRSLKSGQIESNLTTNTIADGLKSQLGDINFPIIQQGVQEIIRVTENQIIEAMRLIWSRMKIVIEPSSAVAVAALRQDAINWKNKKVGVVISGGNVDLSQLPF